MRGTSVSTWRSRIVGEGEEAPDQFLANPRNWRIHPKAQQDALASVLDKIGWVQRVVVNRRTGYVVDGHLRVAMAISKGEPSVPVLYVELSEEEEALILATLDPLAAMAAADKEQLGALLESLRGDGLDDLLAQIAQQNRITLEPMGGLTDPDDVPEVSGEPISKRGDVWLCGDHRVMCGDSTNAEDVARLMVGGRQAQMLWTDPPYGVSYVGKTERELTITSDDGVNLYELLVASLVLAGAALEAGSPFYIAHPAGELSVTFGRAILGTGWRFHQELQWVKDSMVLGHSDYHIRHETIIYGWTPGLGRSGRGRHRGSRWFGGDSETTVFEIPRPKASREHPTAKPVALVDAHLRNSSRVGDTVIDPFLGSGTTVIAAERLGRRCYGMEIEPRYVDVAVKRWEGFTGREAVLE